MTAKLRDAYNRLIKDADLDIYEETFSERPLSDYMERTRMAREASVEKEINNLAYKVNGARERLIAVKSELEAYKRYKTTFEEYTCDSGSRPTSTSDEESYFIYYGAMQDFFKADKEYKKFLMEEGMIEENIAPLEYVRICFMEVQE